MMDLAVFVKENIVIVGYAGFLIGMAYTFVEVYLNRFLRKQKS